MKRFSLFIFILIFLFGSMGMSMAQPRGPHGPGMERGWWGMLDLTDEQISKISDLRLQFLKEIQPLRNQLMSLRGELKLKLTEDSFDQKSVEKLVDQISDIRSKIQLKRISHLRAIRDVLTVEQRKKFDLHLISGRHGKMWDDEWHEMPPAGRPFQKRMK